jgi:hypothetical protein
MQRDPAANATFLANYGAELAQFQTQLKLATKFANSDEQRAALADDHQIIDGPQGWIQSNENAFALKAAGKYAEAEKSYFAVSAAPIVVAGDRYRADLTARALHDQAEELEGLIARFTIVESSGAPARARQKRFIPRAHALGV